jgi:hypothetical protein
MRIRITQAGYALAAGVAVTAMLGMSVASAGAATSKPKPTIKNATNDCGASCIDISFVAPGHHYILKDHDGFTNKNNPIALTLGSDGLPSEDFSYTTAGTVDTEYCTTTGQPTTGSVFTANQCHLLIDDGYGPDETYELAYNPDKGGPENMCLGDWDNDVNLPSGWEARLEPCGVDAATVLIGAQSLFGATLTGDHYWLVSGASNNFTNPLVLTDSDTVAWQAPHWDTLDLNGSEGIDTQEIHAVPGPF